MTTRPRHLIDTALNSEGRSPGHIALGLAVTVGAALLVSTVAARVARPTAAPLPGGGRATTEKPRTALSAIVPAVMSATTLSNL
ncbi:MAG TPA: hypothetical protein VLJ13_05350, partial [Brevundimonas sp.]|nr:hypothetical protein [Brevundimonas sp.]